MLQKFFVIGLALAATMIVQWYGNFSGKLPAKGSFLGLEYDSIYLRAFFTQIEYVWVLIIINLLFTLTFNVGFAAFKNNFLAVITIYLAAGPLCSLLMSALILKEKVAWPALVGLLLVFVGSVLVVAQKEVASLLSK